MDDVDFNALVTAFERECKKAGNVRTEAAAGSSVANKKRSLTQSSSYSRGGGSKRGRYK
jgi:hypothetical protein